MIDFAAFCAHPPIDSSSNSQNVKSSQYRVFIFLTNNMSHLPLESTETLGSSFVPNIQSHLSNTQATSHMLLKSRSKHQFNTQVFLHPLKWQTHPFWNTRDIMVSQAITARHLSFTTCYMTASTATTSTSSRPTRQPCHRSIPTFPLSLLLSPSQSRNSAAREEHSSLRVFDHRNSPPNGTSTCLIRIGRAN